MRQRAAQKRPSAGAVASLQKHLICTHKQSLKFRSLRVTERLGATMMPLTQRHSANRTEAAAAAAAERAALTARSPGSSRWLAANR